MGDASMRGYMICTSPRTGSELLCQLLASTGVLGNPIEYFNTLGRRARTEPGFPRRRTAQLAAVTTRGRTPNGVYGVKVFPGQLERVRIPAWPVQLPGLAFVHLECTDLVDQAISAARARQTGQWRSGRVASRQPTYDIDLISDCLRAAVLDQARWRQYFARNDIPALHLTYDEVVAHPQDVVDRVAAHIGLDEPTPIDPTHVDVSVQRDAVSAQWKERFLAEASDLSHLPALVPSLRELPGLRQLRLSTAVPRERATLWLSAVLTRSR